MMERVPVGGDGGAGGVAHRRPVFSGSLGEEGKAPLSLASSSLAARAWAVIKSMIFFAQGHATPPEKPPPAGPAYRQSPMTPRPIFRVSLVTLSMRSRGIC